MGGGLIQLVALGAQDVYLTGNPQMTFFKVIYKKHTNFAKECINQPLDGGNVGRKSCILSRNADLIQEIYLKSKIKLTTGQVGTTTTSYVSPELLDGTSLISDVELQIGGQRIDKHYHQWLDMYNELFEKNHNTRVTMCSLKKTTTINNEGFIYIPLRFWFNKNPGLALPLISLQYHDVSIILNLDNKLLRATVTKVEGVGGTPVTYTDHAIACGDTLTTNTIKAEVSDSVLMVNYIYLDTNERRAFAQTDHEYLIEQVQFTGVENKSKFLLTFNHPIKALYWNIYTSSGDLSLTPATMPVSEIGLKLNGHDRFSNQAFDYFHLVQPYECNLGNGWSMDNKTRKWSYEIVNANKRNNLSLYSFALNPREHQPSGTCNFSRIDRAEITFSGFDSVNDTIYMFAVNYNIFKVVSGMGGLTYSN